MHLNKIDRIFVITLTTAYDRQKKFKENNSELVKLPIFEWLYVDKEADNANGFYGQRSVFENHRKIVGISKERKYNTVMIFEDDAKPLKSWTEFVNYINDLQMPQKWNYIMLGYLPVKTTKTTNKNLLLVNCAYDTHAYIVNITNAKDIIYNPKCPQIDYLFCDCKSPTTVLKNPLTYNKLKIGIVYAFYPLLFIQETNKNQLSANQSYFFNFYKDVFNRDTSANISIYFNTISIGIVIIIVCFVIFMLIVLLIVSTKYKNRNYINYIIYLLLTFLIIMSLSTGIIYGINNNIKIAID